MTRQLSEHELQLWLRVAGTLKPLKNQTAHQPAVKNQKSPAAKQSEPASLGSSRRSTPAPAPPATPATTSLQDHSGHRRIRRGQVAIDGTLDLHGHTQLTARRELRDFVHFYRAQGARCLLIITGKGRAGAGLLRRRFLDWIEEPELRAFVAGYAPANTRHGGDGAYYLLLKRNSHEHDA